MTIPSSSEQYYASSSTDRTAVSKVDFEPRRPWWIFEQRPYPNSIYRATLLNRPSPLKWSFLRWKESIIETKREPTDWIALKTYYVSTSGDDNDTGLTEDDPIQTLAKVQEIVDAMEAGVSQYTVFLFKRGDTWEEPVSNGAGTNGSDCVFRFNRPHVGAGAYGDPADPKPFVNRFVNKHTSGWAVHSGNVYSKVVAEDVAWVRRSDNRLGAMYRANDSAGAAEDIPETDGSWFFDNGTGTLYVNLGGTDPNTVALETVDSNNEAVELFADGTYVEDMRFDGLGLHRTDTATQGGVRGGVRTTSTCRIERVEAYYGSSHVLHYNAFAGASGGICLMIDCIAGYANYNSSGETIFNAFSTDGEFECYVKDCECPYGTLPSRNWYNPANADGVQISGAAFYTHTGGSADSKFVLVDGLKSDHDNPWGPSNISYNADSPPDNDDIAQAMFISIGETFFNSRRGINIFRIAPLNGVRLCAHLKGFMDDRGQRAVSNTNQVGWFINSVLDVDYDEALVNAQGIFNGPGNSTMEIYFSRIIQRSGSSTHDLRINYDAGSSWSGGNIANSVFARIGTYDQSLALTSGSVPADNNAVYNFKSADTGDNAVDITVEAETEELTTIGEDFAVYRNANTEIGELPQYDRLFNRRYVNTSIGDLR